MPGAVRKPHLPGLGKISNYRNIYLNLIQFALQILLIKLTSLQVRFVNLIVDIGALIDQFLTDSGPMLWILLTFINNRKYD